jgi:O-6-methylguanine DNA methyltransferase
MSIEQALAELAVVAPKDVFAGIMVGTGLWDEFALFDGPTEPLYVAWSRRGVTACVPVSALGDDEFTSRHPRPARQATSIPRRIERPLRDALASGRLGNLPVDLSALGEFQRAVLEKCAQIPPGEIRPYGWIAKEIGKPDAVRAVGSALGRNPVPILIPCHRVVRTDGHIGNYAFGTQMKWDLLEAEGVDPLQIEAAARRRVRYTGSDTTHIYCYPTCRHAKRVVDTHRVEFRSADEARSDGYRPCKVCRPAA